MAQQLIYGRGLVPLSEAEAQRLKCPAPPAETVAEKIARLEAELEALKGEVGL